MFQTATASRLPVRLPASGKEIPTERKHSENFCFCQEKIRREFMALMALARFRVVLRMEG
jgi:hypothetical protein